MKSGTLFLPVYKQGCDLAHHLDNEPTVADAFLALAKNYEEAATMCQKVASIASEYPLEVEADTHWISILGSDEVIERLVQDNLLEDEDLFDEPEFLEMDEEYLTDDDIIETEE